MHTMNDTALDAFMHHLEHVQRRSRQTVRTYRYTLNYWLAWLGDRPISDVRPEDVELWAQRERRGGKTPSAHTMRREIVVARTFHQWAAERDYGAAMLLSAHAPSVKRRAPKPINDATWLKLWRSDLCESDRMMFGLGYFCGLRRVELVTLRPQDVNVPAGEMRFIRKGGSPEPIEYRLMGSWLRDLPIGEGFDDWLELFESTVGTRQLLGANNVWWESIDWPSADSERLARRLRAALRAVNLPPNAFTLHQLRHSCATNLMRGGCPMELIRDAMSHSSFDITSMYAKTSGQMARELTKRDDHERQARYG
jgi:site-specific recombinase XerD